jgi:hypothetical protein
MNRRHSSRLCGLVVFVMRSPHSISPNEIGHTQTMLSTGVSLTWFRKVGLFLPGDDVISVEQISWQQSPPYQALDFFKNSATVLRANLSLRY